MRADTNRAEEWAPSVVVVGIDVGSLQDRLAVVVAGFGHVQAPGRRPVPRAELYSAQAVPGVNYGDMAPLLLEVIRGVVTTYSVPVFVGIDKVGSGQAVAAGLGDLIRREPWTGVTRPQFVPVHIGSGNTVRSKSGGQLNIPRAALIGDWLVAANSGAIDMRGLARTEAAELRKEMSALNLDVTGRADHGHGEHDDLVMAAAIGWSVGVRRGLGGLAEVFNPAKLAPSAHYVVQKRREAEREAWQAMTPAVRPRREPVQPIIRPVRQPSRVWVPGQGTAGQSGPVSAPQPAATPRPSGPTWHGSAPF
jgi:hypothetical protein